MRSERYNIYDKAHSRLRSRLLEAGLSVQSAGVGGKDNRNDSLEIIGQTNHLISQYLDQSIRILEMVVPAAPYIAFELEKENYSTREIIDHIMNLLHKVKQVNTNSLRKRIVAEMQQSFFELTAAVLRIMNRQEMIINDLLWNEYSDEEIIRLEKNLNAPLVQYEEAEIKNVLNESSSMSPLLMNKLFNWSVTEELSNAGEKLTALIRKLIAPGKWSFANRVYNLTRPGNLLSILMLFISCITIIV